MNVRTYHTNMSWSMLLANNPMSQFELKTAFEDTSFLMNKTKGTTLNLFVSPVVAKKFNDTNNLVSDFSILSAGELTWFLQQGNIEIKVYTDTHLTNFDLNPDRLRHALNERSSGFELGNSVLYQLNIIAKKSGVLPTGQFLKFDKNVSDVVNDANSMSYEKRNFGQYLISEPIFSLSNDLSIGFNLGVRSSQRVVSFENSAKPVLLADSLHELVIFGSYRFGEFITAHDNKFEPNDLDIWLDYVGYGVVKDGLVMYSLIDSEIYDKTVIGTYADEPIILVLDRVDASQNGIYLGSIEPEQLLAYTLTEFLKRTLLYL